MLGKEWVTPDLVLVPNPGRHRMPHVLRCNTVTQSSTLTTGLWHASPKTPDARLVSLSSTRSCGAGAWNRKFGLLFIDQPVGTGFSKKGRWNGAQRTQVSY
jgi:Serine carboxypeptidase